MTNPTLDKPANRQDWERAVKHHAERIKGIISHQVFGWNITDNKDALIVAVYLKGVEEGRKNSEKVLAEMVIKMEAENAKNKG